MYLKDEYTYKNNYHLMQNLGTRDFYYQDSNLRIQDLRDSIVKFVWKIIPEF